MVWNTAIRSVLLLVAFAAASPAWVESVEFRWNEYPKPLWERELVWIKNIGIAHVSLPQTGDEAGLRDAIAIVRRLGIEADLEGPTPEALLPLTRTHGGPVTEPLPGTTARISLLDANAMTEARERLSGGAPAILWTDVHDTLGPTGFRAGARNFTGEDALPLVALRRNALLSAYWGGIFSTLQETPGAGVRSTPAPTRLDVRQFTAANGSSLVAVVNRSDKAWSGDLKALYPALKRVIGLPNVTVPAHEALWLPVSVPLAAGPLCRDCNAFAPVDHLVYATAELTTMEYENGILAMEFSAPGGGEVILQLSRQPSGPLVAGGKPVAFDWDDHELRARLQIPPGAGPDKRVRIGLAIEPPDATAFFTSARVLTIGETNRLAAEFSSEAIAGRSRLRMKPELPVAVEPADAGRTPLGAVYDIKVPETALDGDHVDLALEADGMRMSHANPQLRRPVSVTIADVIDVRLAARSVLPLFPGVVPVNQRTGRDVIVKLSNNTPEIRNFHLELSAEGLEFSPSKVDFSVGASLARDASFRIYARDATPGVHRGIVKVSGASRLEEPVNFVVVPATGEVAFQSGPFSLIESAKLRAAFLPGRLLELVDKENARSTIEVGGREFTPGPIAVEGDALIFGKRRVTLEDLKAQAVH